ncbi:MAG TPA: ankyrin repeat domain-containing protein [Sphingomicrobium sp.]|nr:ankyrin repeat domain-containing protein [Sphingomicrobium sp.]
MVRLVRALAMAAALVAAPAAAQLYGSDGEAFVSAMREGEFSKALDLVEKPGSTVVNYRGKDGDAGLHIAVRHRNANWVGFLLARDADPNLGNDDGDTPLILATRLGFSEGVARMLMNGAIVDTDNKLGETALIVGVQGRQTNIVRMLLEAGADPDKPDHASGYSAREYAKRDNRSTEILRLIETVKSKKAVAVGPVKP